MKTHIFITTSLLLAGWLLLTGCKRHEDTPSNAIAQGMTVSVMTASMREHERHQWLPGTVFPVDQAIISSKLMATVEETRVTIGQAVDEGDVLIVLRANEMDARVEQAEATLAQVKRNYLREKALLQQHATTAETVRTLEDQLRVVEAQLAEAKTMQLYKVIRAPFSGTITARNVRRGDLVTPGAPLLSLDGAGQFEIQIQVPDSLSIMEYGKVILVEADGAQIETRIKEWSPAADPRSRSRLVKLAAPEKVELRSGQYVRASWPAGMTESLWLPDSAIQQTGQLARLYTVVDKTARMVLIRKGKSIDGETQVVSGLNSGSIVIMDPPDGLRDGTPVAIEQ
jgi:RND family efflux transporter MFP subunit